MQTSPLYSSEPPTIEAGVNSLLHDVKTKAECTCRSCEDRIRQSPGKAVLLAVAAGYCLHRLPVRSLLATQVRLLGAIAPPALFAFGAAKLCEYLQDQARR